MPADEEFVESEQGVELDALGRDQLGGAGTAIDEDDCLFDFEPDLLEGGQRIEQGRGGICPCRGGFGGDGSSFMGAAFGGKLTLGRLQAIGNGSPTRTQPDCVHGEAGRKGRHDCGDDDRIHDLSLAVMAGAAITTPQGSCHWP